MNRRFLLILMLMPCSFMASSQDIVKELKEAENFELRLDEMSALTKYRQLAGLYPENKKILIKTSLLNSSVGGRQKTNQEKLAYCNEAQSFALKALATDPLDADANYAMAVSLAELSALESESKKIIEEVKLVYEYDWKALHSNPNHARANFVLGKWHEQVADLSWLKKAAVQLAFGGLPPASQDSAIIYMERCRSLDPYYVLNYLELARLYKAQHHPDRALEILNKMVRLPNRTADDALLKQQGQQLLNELQ